MYDEIFSAFHVVKVKALKYLMDKIVCNYFY